MFWFVEFSLSTDPNFLIRVRILHEHTRGKSEFSHCADEHVFAAGAVPVFSQPRFDHNREIKLDLKLSCTNSIAAGSIELGAQCQGESG